MTSWSISTRRAAVACSRFFRFVDHALLDLVRHFFVATELLGVYAASAGKRAQDTCVAVEFHRGNVGADDLKLSVDIRAENAPAAAGKTAHDFAHAIFWNAHLDQIDRFEQTGPRFHERFLKPPIARDLEGDVLRIYRMHQAVVKIRLHVHDVVAGENPFGACPLDAALDRWHEHTVHALA